MNGRVTVAGTDADGRNIKRTVSVVDGEIVDNAQTVEGKLVHRIVYGKFESEMTPAGREVTHFNPGKGTGKHGLSRRYGKLFGHEGCCHSWFKQGRLVRQKFVYDCGVLAYDWQGGRKPCEIRDYYGKPKYRITGAIDGRSHFSGISVFDRDMNHWFLQSQPFKVEQDGRVIFAGQYKNSQRVGCWIVPDSKTLAETFGLKDAERRSIEAYYEHGVAIPKDMYHAKPEELDLKKLLQESNAQLRMAMLEKARGDRNFGKRLAALGKVVHRDRDMRLYHVDGLPTRVLRVTCPSTNSLYYINVPKDSRKCEEARQWTFHVGAGVRLTNNEIKFAQET
jgi:hypothetical protein